jgi:hypothetical protein
MFKKAINKLTHLPYLPGVLLYCLGTAVVFFRIVQRFGKNTIETIGDKKIDFDLGSVFWIISFVILANFTLSLYLDSFNKKYSQLLLIVNYFFLVLLYFIIFLSIKNF